MNEDLMITYTRQRHAEFVADADRQRQLAGFRQPLRHRLAIHLHRLADTIDIRPRPHATH